jgi:hypothetical protein
VKRDLQQAALARHVISRVAECDVHSLDAGRQHAFVPARIMRDARSAVRHAVNDSREPAPEFARMLT